MSSKMNQQGPSSDLCEASSKPMIPYLTPNMADRIPGEGSFFASPFCGRIWKCSNLSFKAPKLQFKDVMGNWLQSSEDFGSYNSKQGGRNVILTDAPQRLNCPPHFLLHTDASVHGNAVPTAKDRSNTKKEKQAWETHHGRQVHAKSKDLTDDLRGPMCMEDNLAREGWLPLIAERRRKFEAQRHKEVTHPDAWYPNDRHDHQGGLSLLATRIDVASEVEFDGSHDQSFIQIHHSPVSLAFTHEEMLVSMKLEVEIVMVKWGALGVGETRVVRKKLIGVKMSWYVEMFESRQWEVRPQVGLPCLRLKRLKDVLKVNRILAAVYFVAVFQSSIAGEDEIA
ncbi:hypothetical protein Tco_0764298 [Tanacetum coccineum]